MEIPRADAPLIRANDTAPVEASRYLGPPARLALAALSRADRNMRDIDTGLAGISQAVVTFANLAGSIAGAANDARDTFKFLLSNAASDREALDNARIEIATMRNTLAKLALLEATNEQQKRTISEMLRTRTAMPASPPGAAVANPPKAKAATKKPKKEIVLDPDGHPVSNRIPAAKKAR